LPSHLEDDADVSTRNGANPSCSNDLSRDAIA